VVGAIYGGFKKIEASDYGKHAKRVSVARSDSGESSRNR
jgi:hypothetical protein